MHTIQISISTTKYFDNQNQMAEFLGIKNTSKKAINSRCRVYGYGVQFDDYYGEYNIDLIQYYICFIEKHFVSLKKSNIKYKKL